MSGATTPSPWPLPSAAVEMCPSATNPTSGVGHVNRGICGLTSVNAGSAVLGRVTTRPGAAAAVVVAAAAVCISVMLQRWWRFEVAAHRNETALLNAAEHELDAAEHELFKRNDPRRPAD